MEHPQTPRLTDHARQRCQEMGVATKRVKRILRDPDMGYTAREGRHIAWRRDDPTIAVVFVMREGIRLALTVVPRTQERYERSSGE